MTAEAIEERAQAIEKKIESICIRMKRMVGSNWSEIMRELHEINEQAGHIRRDAHALNAVVIAGSITEQSRPTSDWDEYQNPLKGKE